MAKGDKEPKDKTPKPPKGEKEEKPAKAEGEKRSKYGTATRAWETRHFPLFDITMPVFNTRYR
jgi:hypothetical protein